MNDLEEIMQDIDRRLKRIEKYFPGKVPSEKKKRARKDKRVEFYMKQLKKTKAEPAKVRQSHQL